MVKCFQISPPSPPSSVTVIYTSVDVKQIITAWLHPDITLEIMCRHFNYPSSSHTWQTYSYLSPRPLFHSNSNWRLSHPCWKNLVYQIGFRKFQIRIGFRFATELALKLLRLLSRSCNFSSHPILHLSSQHDMYQREHSDLLRLCQYVFLHLNPSWQPPNRFHLLL